MNINQETLDFLRKQHIHFCLPMYGGQCNEATFISMIKFCIIAQKVGLNYSIDTMVNESLIPRGRNNLVSKMLFNKEATHLFWIDVDLGFDPDMPQGSKHDALQDAIRQAVGVQNIYTKLKIRPR